MYTLQRAEKKALRDLRNLEIILENIKRYKKLLSA